MRWVLKIARALVAVEPSNRVRGRSTRTCPRVAAFLARYLFSLSVEDRLLPLE
jgi:hypothetical protein